MEITEQIKLRFTGVDFPSVSLKSIKSYTDNSESSKIDVKIDPKVFLPKDKLNTFSIIMNVDIAAMDHFTINVVAIGYFELSQEDVTEEIRKDFINANSTAIMFPYVRAFISTLTSNVGNVMNKILLPTRFFKGELEEIFLTENTPTILNVISNPKID